MRELWELFCIFLRIGAFTFGGGYAMLPLLRTELIDKRNWMTQEQVMDCYAVAQCAPGIIMVNTAVLVGYQRRGLLGGIVCALGTVVPSLVIIISISAFLQSFSEIAWVQHAFGGIRVAVLALVVTAIVSLVKAGCRDWFGWGLCIITFVLTAWLSISPIWCIIGAGLLGLVVTGLRREATK